MRISDWSSDVCSSDLEGMVVAVGRAGGAIDELVAARHRGAGQKMHAVAIDVRDGLGAGRLDVEQVERLEAVRAAPVTALVPDAAPRDIPSVPLYEADDVPRAVPNAAVDGPEIPPAAVYLNLAPARPPCITTPPPKTP